VARWSLAIGVSAAAFALSWWVSQEQARLDVGTSLGLAGAVLAVVLAGTGWWAAREQGILGPVRRWMKHRERDKDTTGRVSREDSSWRVTTLALFSVTVALAGLAVLGDTRAGTSSHFSTTDLFTDLAGAGSVIGGVATMLVFLSGYRGRRKRNRQQATNEV